MSTPTVNHLAVVSIRTNCISETVDFYQNVIGLSGAATRGRQAAFGLGSGLFLVITESDEETDPTPKQPRYPLLAFAVPDLGVTPANETTGEGSSLSDWDANAV